MPAYNAGKFIADALRSIHEQSHRPIEVIVVNDGPTDSSASIVDAYAAEHSRRPQLKPMVSELLGILFGKDCFVHSCESLHESSLSISCQAISPESFGIILIPRTVHQVQRMGESFGVARWNKQPVASVDDVFRATTCCRDYRPTTGKCFN
jgi:glycosyltransferase involved in cell wall biosynthesis